MKFRYHVITPFSRFQNLVEFSRMLHSHRVIWHPILNDDLPFGIHNISWIEACYCGPSPAGSHPANHALNWFLDHTTLEPEDRYLILADDDFYEPGFFCKIDHHEGEVIICSMLRGHHQPPSGPDYGTATLIADPGNMKIGQVGCEQLIVSGQILAPCRFRPEPYADGILIEQLATEHKFEFAPEAYVWFNYLEPGRWDR